MQGDRPHPYPLNCSPKEFVFYLMSKGEPLKISVQSCDPMNCDPMSFQLMHGRVWHSSWADGLLSPGQDLVQAHPAPSTKASQNLLIIARIRTCGHLMEENTELRAGEREEKQPQLVGPSPSGEGVIDWQGILRPRRNSGLLDFSHPTHLRVAPCPSSPTSEAPLNAITTNVSTREKGPQMTQPYPHPMS